MYNEVNQLGSPPASKSEILKLKKYKLTDDILKSFGNEDTCSL